MSIDPLFSSHRRPTDDEIAQILDRVVSGDMTDAEFDAAVLRLASVRRRLLKHLLQMVSSPEENVHQAASTLLREMRMEQAVGPLRSMLTASDLDDDHKLSILQALQELGGVEPGEDPFMYLRDPEAVLRRSKEEFLRLLQDPVQLELVLRSILEGRLMLLSSDESLAILASSMDSRLKFLFLCMLHAPDNRLVLRAVEGLTLLQDASVVPILLERARFDGAPSVRRACRQAARELKEGGEPGALSVLTLPVAPPPLVRCLLSTIDGDGGQVLLVVRKEEGSAPVFWNVVFNDHEGIKESIGSDDDTLADLEESLTSGMSDIGVGMVEVSLDRVRTEIGIAYQTTLNAHRRLPPSFLAWQSWLTGGDEVVPSVFSVPDLCPDEQGVLLRRSHELFSLDEFNTWVLGSEDLGGLERRFRRLLGRHGTRDAVDALVGEAVEKLVSPTFRGLLKLRLERQAWLLAQVYVDQDIPKMAMAAAAAIGEDADQPLTGHPFVRELVFSSLARSVGVGL